MKTRYKEEDNSLIDFLREIGRYPILQREEEIELGYQVQAVMASACAFVKEHRRWPDPSQFAELSGLPLDEAEAVLERGLAARNKFVRHNLRLAAKIAKRYSQGRDLLDLIQEGAQGIARAAEKFDPKRGYKFSTYAYWWIEQAVTRSVYQTDRSVRLPVHLRESLSKLRRFQLEFRSKHDRYPTNEEIAQGLQWAIGKIDFLREQMSPILSLDLKVGDKEDTDLLDLFREKDNNEDDSLTQCLMIEDVRAFLDRVALTEQQRQVIFLRFGLGLSSGRCLTLTEVGEILGISRERVRQIQTAAIRQLRLAAVSQRNHQLKLYITSDI
ncbi:MAG: sigma-70 family RNA polymerase sigma factor [Leptodesmis sp.]|uniref:sigma-70 family RNA polymerase sigma factor n=1 Tax=Leptodesmis sp. TaxID=3100501 RepID=UPI003D0DAC44